MHEDEANTNEDFNKVMYDVAVAELTRRARKGERITALFKDFLGLLLIGSVILALLIY